MSKTARRLGRGLDSLISSTSPTPDALPKTNTAPPVSSAAAPSAVDLASAESALGDQRRSLHVADMSPNPFQPRGEPTADGIETLAASIRTNGILQPVLVRKTSSGYQIIAGERRWRAAKIAGLEEIPVIVREIDDREMLEIALVENIQREDLNAVERARSYKQYCDNFTLTPDRLAHRLGEDRTTVTNYIRLLELPQDVLDLVAGGRLTMGHARSLVGVRSDSDRRRLARAVVANQLSVRALEEIVRGERSDGDDSAVGPDGSARAIATSGGRSQSAHIAHIADLEQRLSMAVGMRVQVQEGKRKGTGRIVIEYGSLDEFELISERLGLSME